MHRVVSFHCTMPRSLLLASAFALLFLVTCATEPILPPLLEGPQTLTGTVVSMVISTARRGTHVLKQDGKDLAYLESTTVNLRQFQGRTAALKGHYERNTDPEDLPVLIVQNVVSSEESVHPWSSPSLSLSGDIPSLWGVTGTGDTVAFIPAGSLHPVVTVRMITSTSLPNGVTLRIGGRSAIRFLDELSGEQRLGIELNGGYLELAFTPQHQTDPEQSRADWLAFLKSLKVFGAIGRGSSRQAMSSAVSTATREGQHCGGLAGILCPSGQYCAITDLEQNIGVCRKIQ